MFRAVEAWIIDAARTPIGRYGGALSSVRPDDLAAQVIAGVIQRTGAPPEAIDDVQLGCANGAGEDNRNVARMAAARVRRRPEPLLVGMEPRQCVE
jgi:acetyl-CoA acetyltransferase